MSVLTRAVMETYVVGEELMRRAFENASLGCCILGSDGRLIRVNQAFCDLLGYRSDELVGRSMDEISHPASSGDGLERGWTLRPGEQVLVGAERRLLHHSGHGVDVQLTASVVGGLEGGPAYVIVHVQDVTLRNAAERRIAHLAMHDALTDLPNRALFLDRLEQGLRRLPRGGGLLAVLFVDLDRFKHVNDRFGHAAGDRVLIEVAARLRRALRPEDTLARLGGDEFTILCEGLIEEPAVVALAERILRSIIVPLPVHGTPVTLSASVGIALSRDGSSTDGEAMLHDADLAMYRAKERGRNRHEVFDEKLRERTAARLDQTNSLQRAIHQGELRVHFQPLVHLDDGGVAGVEALVRWERPGLGLLMPDAFVVLAEESGQIVPLGSWVLEEACREVAAWTPGFAPHEVSVNLSARQLGHPELVPSIERTLRRTGLDPSRLCVEVTESVLMDDVETSVDALGDLKRLGVRIAIDDFGTGYSSLSYLRRLPVDVVKIDRSFIAGLRSDAASDAIVAAVVNLAHALGFTVVAEGVETEEQVVALRALRCDLGQGYYWSAAMPADRLRRWQGSRTPERVTARALDVCPVIAGQVEAVRAATGRKVLLRAPDGLPPAFADPTAVRIVLDHLLSNALQYSPPDRPVIISARADRRWLSVTVADFGIGMSADQTARCFEQFWQAGVREAPRSGTGIGLYVVRSLVEAMGGHVAVRSALGKGSTFTVALPRSARSASRAHAPSGAALDVGEPSSIREFMRQIGVPMRRET